jgi:hypothetical protein
MDAMSIPPPPPPIPPIPDVSLFDQLVSREGNRESLLLRGTLLLILINPLNSQLTPILYENAVADLGEVTLDKVPVGLLLGQPSPVLVLELLLSENKDNSSGSDHLFRLLLCQLCPPR